MSRAAPKTGKAIACRLPLEADKKFREIARTEGLSPGEMLRQIVMNFIA